MDFELTGKVAIVAGGSRGIGKAVAHVLTREGADVALISRDLTAGKLAAEEIANQSRRKTRAYSADTGDDAAVKNAISQIAAEFNRIAFW